MKWIIITILAVAIGYWLGRRRIRRIINPQQVAKHKENLDKVMGLFDGRDEISNDLVENSLGVSHATAERYLQELEEQGKLTQIGDIGQNVKYKKA